MKWVVCILVIVFFLSGCGTKGLVKLADTEKPPKPTIIVDGQMVPVIQGSYCWSGDGVSRCEDKISPLELVKKQTPIVAPPESKVEVKFDVKPKDGSLGANLWINDKPTKVQFISNNKLVIPKEKGIYVYDVYANWDKGDSSYAFALEVK
jgi:predicted small lipoprotein YifL